MGRVSVRVGVLHATVFVANFTTLAYDILVLEGDSSRTYAGKLKFLTFWNDVLQTVYFGLALFNDLLGTNSFARGHCSPLQRCRDSFLASIVWPFGTFVVLTFWTLYAIDRELVFPRRLDAIIPLWVNHMEHTAVLPSLLLDKYMVYHHYPRRRIGITVTLLFGLVYIIWIFWVAIHADIWVYPILAVLSWSHRGLFLLALWLTLGIIYLSGEYLTGRWWPASRRLVKSE